MHLAVAEPLLAPLELGQRAVDVELLLEHALLDLRDLDAPVLHLALDLAPQRDRLLARFDLRLTANRLGLPLRIGEQLLALDPRAPGRANATSPSENDRRAECSDDDSDERCAGREHGASVGGCRWPRRSSADALTRTLDLHGRVRRSATRVYVGWWGVLRRRAARTD